MDIPDGQVERAGGGARRALCQREVPHGDRQSWEVDIVSIYEEGLVQALRRERSIRQCPW